MSERHPWESAFPYTHFWPSSERFQTSSFVYPFATLLQAMDQQQLWLSSLPTPIPPSLNLAPLKTFKQNHGIPFSGLTISVGAISTSLNKMQPPRLCSNPEVSNPHIDMVSFPVLNPTGYLMLLGHSLTVSSDARFAQWLSFSLEGSFPRHPHGCSPHYRQASAQMSPLLRDHVYIIFLVLYLFLICLLSIFPH